MEYEKNIINLQGFPFLPFSLVHRWPPDHLSYPSPLYLQVGLLFHLDPKRELVWYVTSEDTFWQLVLVGTLMTSDVMFIAMCMGLRGRVCAPSHITWGPISPFSPGNPTSPFAPCTNSNTDHDLFKGTPYPPVLTFLPGRPSLPTAPFWPFVPYVLKQMKWVSFRQTGNWGTPVVLLFHPSLVFLLYLLVPEEKHVQIFLLSYSY